MRTLEEIAELAAKRMAHRLQPGAFTEAEAWILAALREAVAQERAALREEGTHVCRTSCDPDHKACFWRIPYPRLDSREKSE